MKFIQYSIFLTVIIFLSASCGSNVDRPDPVLSSNEIAQKRGEAAPAIVPSGGALSSVQHYYCANNCAGSGGDAAGSCPVCGTEYVHNQAFHNTPGSTDQQAPPAVEPDQNASGVWHYTCSNGCSGGAGSAIACGQCGNTLAHNTLYHN